jgi:outer membrane beta-barrel protein
MPPKFPKRLQNSLSRTVSKNSLRTVHGGGIQTMPQLAEGAVMKQGLTWLIVAAALLLVPHAALAQAPKKTPKAPATAPAAPAAPAPGGELELDAPAPGAAVPGAEVAVPAPGAEAATGGGGICEIDPSACPKAEDISKAAKKNVNAEIYAVQQIYALRARRFEIQPYWSFSLNDQFVNHPGPGLALNYYITNVLAIGVNGTFYDGLNEDSAFNFQNRRAAHIATPLNEYFAQANLNFTYVPIYGKFAGFSNFIFHYDAYILGGVGMIDTRPIAVIDPDNRNFSFKPKINFDIGIGLRIFFNRWFAAILEIRDYMYSEEIESINVAAGTAAASPSTWFGPNQFTNDVQAQVGISIFLPFSWEYRLPK